MSNSSNSEILLYTRPLAPPWDEASKNLARDIALHANKKFKFRILTTKDYAQHLNNNKNFNSNIIPEPIFSSTKFDFFVKFLLLKRLFRIKLNADIVHFLFTPRSITSSLIKSRFINSKTKTIQTIATIAESSFSDSKRLKKLLFANFIITQSKYTKNRLLQAGINNVDVIYPGINLQKFNPQPKKIKLLNEFGLNHDDFIILFAGEYVRLNATDDVIDSFGALLKNKRPGESFKLICACRIKSSQDKQKKLEIIEKTKKLAYYKHIVFIDTFSDMSDLYNLSDLNIFPVREMVGKFDIPLAVVEAMACKKPVIISDIPVLEEFVKHDQTGIVVPRALPNILSNKILEISRDKSELNRIAQNSLDFAINNFDISNTAYKYSSLYESLITN